MNKYTEKKQKNQVLKKFIEKYISEASLELIEDCDTFMMFVGDETMEKKKQHKGNSCKNRFCPICAWRKAKKDALALSVMMEYIKEEHQKEFIFLTLTAPNVPAEELNDEIKDYNKAFQRLMQRQEVKKVVKGYARKLEITYNEERNDYHPHFHVLIAVNKSYFQDRKQYINHDRWLDLWRQVTKNPLITQVDVRKLRKNSKKEIAEVAKYGAKDSDYLVNQEVFDVFYQSLKGKQIIVYSGLFKDAMKLFKAGDLDKFKEIDTTRYVYAIMYNWGQSDYVEKERRLLTESEQKEVNRQLIDDMEVE